MPNDAYGSSLLKSAHPLAMPHGLGGNTQVYESKGGYIPCPRASSRPRSAVTRNVPGGAVVAAAAGVRQVGAASPANAKRRWWW